MIMFTDQLCGVANGVSTIDKLAHKKGGKKDDAKDEDGPASATTNCQRVCGTRRALWCAPVAPVQGGTVGARPRRMVHQTV